MKFISALALSLAATTAAATGAAEDAVVAWQEEPARVFDASEVTLDAFKWQARPVVVFADSPLDPAFQTQMDNLLDEIEEVVERDIVLITDTSPNDGSELRTKLRPRGFQFVLIGKDGGVKLRKPFPWDVRELSRTIDKMPMRQREISGARSGG
ncbi:MAG: DUF4174 domain-containing protein [Rhodobacteraceae bacterium]|nr:DUF4174 domain-containing protein [Paracoccaceae bacterium]